MFRSRKRRKALIVKPRSRFLKVRCRDCSAEQVVFNKSSMRVNCLICGKLLLEPTGGKSKIHGEIIAVLE
ncbi:MAG: 30S ribosomal protein S27e [Candidatus Wukongarchaeota archaeon]|nr:30S ribosomal protein S27e [Candidatus Wukongarchaeota archaeon]